MVDEQAGQTRLITDRRGDYEDYIEMYVDKTYCLSIVGTLFALQVVNAVVYFRGSFNPSEAAVDLAGYTLVADDRCDADDEQPKERLSLRGQIEARGYLLIWADNDACALNEFWNHTLKPC